MRANTFTRWALVPMKKLNMRFHVSAASAALSLATPEYCRKLCLDSMAETIVLSQ
jgi:hypothetical protein